MTRVAGEGRTEAAQSIEAARYLDCRVIGHRGAAGAAPENTLASIRKSAGARGELGRVRRQADQGRPSDPVPRRSPGADHRRARRGRRDHACPNRRLDAGAGSARRFAVSRSRRSRTGARAVRRAWPRDQRRDQAVRRAGVEPRMWRYRRWSTCGRGPAGAIGLQLRARVSVRRARYGAGAAARLSRRHSAAAVAADGGARTTMHLNHRRMLPGQRAALWPRHSRGAVYGQRRLARTAAPRGRRRGGHHRSSTGAGCLGKSRMC